MHQKCYGGPEQENEKREAIREDLGAARGTLQHDLFLDEDTDQVRCRKCGVATAPRYWRSLDTKTACEGVFKSAEERLRERKNRGAKRKGGAPEVGDASGRGDKRRRVEQQGNRAKAEGKKVAKAKVKPKAHASSKSGQKSSHW